MNRFAQLCALALALGIPGLAGAENGGGAFATCGDAYNYGRNTTSLFVSQAFNRLACNASKVDLVEKALARSIARRATLLTSDDALIKACYFDGFYAGYIETLVSEYRDCEGTARFASVPRESIALAASAVFTVLLETIGDYAARNDWVIENVFHVDYSFLKRCSNEEACQNACATVVVDQLADVYESGPDYTGSLIEDLIGRVCYPY